TASGAITVGDITTSNSGGVSFFNKNGLNILGSITSSGSISQTKVTGGTSLITFGDTNSANQLILQSTTSGLPVSFDSNMVLNKDVQFKTVGAGAITLGTAGVNNTTITSGSSGSSNLGVLATGGAVINLNSDIFDATNNLGSLSISTVSASGGKINVASRNIKTVGVAGQTYTGNVNYSNNLVLDSGAGAITLNNQLDSTTTSNIDFT
ncbi:MAG: hypothetical protein ACK47R_12080, partial [Planctomycetia bacterium]